MSAYAEDVARRGRGGDGWEPPVPLGHVGKLPVFPAHRLPPWINAYVVALAEAVQVPVDLPAMLVLTALAAAAGGRAYVEVKPGYEEQLNLFTAVAMAPGSRKTPVFMRVTSPLMAYERSAIEKASPEVTEAKIRLAIAKADAIKAQIEAEKASNDARDEATHFAAAKAMMAESITVPTMPRLLVDDATPEALTSLMHEQDGRIAMFSDEGEVFGMMAGRYSSKGPNLSVYLKGHVGSSIRVDRKGRDPEFIEKPALTLGLTVQPVVLSQLLAIEGARGRGLLGRFLWAVPHNNVGYRRSDPDPVPEDIDLVFTANLRQVVANLAEWTDRIALVFTPEARAALLRYQDALEPRLREFGDLGHIGDWAGKLVGHTARIAGLLHLATHVNGAWAGNVEVTHVDDAIKIADYLTVHALQAFEVMAEGPLIENAKALIKWAQEADVSEFSRRQAHRACRYRMPTVEELKPVLELLEGTGHIRRLPEPEPNAKGGRPKGPRYQLSPYLGL